MKDERESGARLPILRKNHFYAPDQLILPEELAQPERAIVDITPATSPAPRGVYFLVAPPLSSNPGFKKVMQALPWFDFCMRWPTKLSAYGCIAIATGMAVTEGPWWSVLGLLGVAGAIGIGAFAAWMKLRGAMGQDDRETR